MGETNWADNLTYSARQIHNPETIDDLRGIVARSRKIKALGSRHSFNGISDTPGDLISTARLPRLFELDRERATVTIDGGARYGDICARLHSEGFALENLASLPHISVSGACATGTHGSGPAHRCLSGSVRAMEIVTADGSLLSVSRETEPDFNGMVVHLGALGIVTRLTLDLAPTFRLRQDVFEELSLDAVSDRFDEIMSGAYSVSLFTDWQSDAFSQVWVKSLVPPGKEQGESAFGRWFGAAAATMPRHPIASLPAECCTEQLGVCGDWHERLPHFRLDHTPSAGEEIQSEYLLPRESALDSFRALRKMAADVASLLMVSEVRTVAADALWMSPAYERDSVAIHFTWARNQAAVDRLLPHLEAALTPFGARPHWGKVFHMNHQALRRVYPKLDAFVSLEDRLDPDGKFFNPFLLRCLHGPDSPADNIT